MSEIDSLEIQIGASAGKANKAIDSLIKKLGDLSGTLDFGNVIGIEKQTSKFNDFQKTIGSISDGMKSLRERMGGSSSSVDSGVGQIAKTITRLANAGDKSTQVASSLPKIGSALKKMTNDMAGVGSVDSGVNKLVSSIARLANSGDKSAVAAKELPKLGDALKRVTESMRGIDGISDSTNTFAQTVAQLANSGDKAGKAASGLGELSQRTLDFFNAMKNAPQISENTIRMTQAMAQLSAAGGRVNSAVKPINSAFSTLAKVSESLSRTLKNALKGIGTILSGTFSKIGQIGLKAANTMKRVAGDMVAAFSRITHSSKGLKTASSNLGTLLKTIIGFKGIQGLVNFGKSAIELGSDITEVENVVDVAFGRMAKSAYDFASTAKEQFGLSELAAKQYSGTMMAMLKSSGVSIPQAAEMSTTLAGLAGDLASFYNIDTDEAFYKLRSAMAGMVAPMRALGVNMHVANLEAFAMSQGITKAYKDMTQAEKAMVRYNYLLSQTKDAQGDFARTAQTWANQTRILKLNFQSLSSVIGQGLISAILPVIQWLNALMAKLMEAAKVFRNFMYTITGYEKPQGGGGIVNDLLGADDAADSLGGLGDAAEDAGNKLKKKLFTLPFDELNILSEESESLSDAIGGIGDIGDIGGFGEIIENDQTGQINEWAKRIRDAFLSQNWEEVGKTVAELLNLGLQKIYDAIVGITPKVEKALRIFAEILNSFVNWVDWDLLGRTIGAGVNLITTAINSLLGDGGINFENIGTKLSTGLRGTIDEIDWTGLGNAIGNWFMVAWRIAEGFIEDMWRIDPEKLTTGWEEAGIAIAEAVNGIFDRINFGSIGKTLANGLNGLFAVLHNFNEKMAADRTWQELSDNISRGLNNAISGIRPIEAAQALGKFVTDLLGTMLKVAETTPWNKLGQKIGQFLVKIPWKRIFWQVFDIITTVLGGLFGGLATEILYNFGRIGTALAEGFNTAFEKLKAFTQSVDWNSIAENIHIGLNNMIHGINWTEAGSTLSDFSMKLFGVLQEAVQNTDWEGLGKGIGEFLSNIDWNGIFNSVFDTVKEVFFGLLDGFNETSVGKISLGIAAMVATYEGLDKIGSVIEPIIEGIFGSDGLIILEIVKGIASMAAALVVGGKDLVDAIADFVHGILDNLLEAVRNIEWSEVWHNIISALGSLISNGWEIIGKIRTIAIEFVGHLIAGLLEYIVSGQVFSDLAEFALNLIKGLVKGFVSQISALIEIPKMIFDAIVNGIKKLFGIHSPSTVMAELGVFVMQGLINGLGSLVKSVLNIFSSIKDGIVAIWENVGKFLGETWDKIRNWASEKFTAAGEIISNAWSVVKELTEKIWGSVSNFIGNTWDSIKGWANEKFKNISDTISKSWDGIKNTSQKVWGDIKDFLGKTWDGLKSWASEKFTNIKNAVATSWDGLKQKTSEVWNSVKTSLGSTWENIKSVASEKFDSMKIKIGNIWDNVKKNTTDTWDNVRNALSEKIPNIVKNVVDGFASLPSNMLTVGKNIVSGIIDGISGFAGNLYNKVSEMAGNVAGWFKDKLGIHSPSKVFYKLAGYTMQGFNDGIDASWTDLQNKLSYVGSSIGQVFSQGFADNALIELPPPNSYKYSIPANVTTNAIINDGQIISGIEEAAYRGFMRAQSETSPYLADIAENTRRTADKDMSVRIGERDIVTAYDRGKSRQGYSFT